MGFLARRRHIRSGAAQRLRYSRMWHNCITLTDWIVAVPSAAVVAWFRHTRVVALRDDDAIMHQTPGGNSETVPHFVPEDIRTSGRCIGCDTTLVSTCTRFSSQHIFRYSRLSSSRSRPHAMRDAQPRPLTQRLPSYSLGGQVCCVNITDPETLPPPPSPAVPAPQ